MVMEVVHEDMGEGNMQCINHPYKNSNPGGICAFCLQEKLGKLVSSSFSVPIFPSSSSASSSSPSFRSEFGGSTTSSATGTAGAAAAVLQAHHFASSSSAYSQNSGNDCNYNGYNTKRSKIPFVMTQKNKKQENGVVLPMVKNNDSSDSSNIGVLTRCKSTATPRRRGMHFLDENYAAAEGYSPYKRGFWSFLYMSKHSNAKRNEHHNNKHYYKDSNFASATPSTVSLSSVSNNGGSVIMRGGKKMEDFVVEENGSPDMERKVSRSRSVGCGSRSFSGDFFERISTGFGDCTLRRVESQREGKPKIQSGNGNNGQDYIKERVKCGGIFSGFMIASSSSSSSSSSYWDHNGKQITPTLHSSSMRYPSHGRSKSWGWALASPMRVFAKPNSNSGKREANSRKNATPDLSAIPSLLAVSG